MADRTVTVTIKATDAFSDVVSKYNTEMGKAGQSTQKVNDSTNALAATIQGAFAALSIQQVISFAENMQQLGDEVNVSRAQFTALTRDMGDSTQILNQLRKATNGVTDDMTLMNASSHLLQTGLVSNTGELSQMLGMLQDLKPAGEDLNSAIDVLSQTLQTGSTRGLNQFGVNVEFVKQRIDELKAAGLGAQDALKQAVFDGMAQSLERLGDAASADETPLKKLQTQLQNIGETASGNFATGVEGFIGWTQAVGQNMNYNERLQQMIQTLYGMPQGSGLTNLLNGTPTGYTDQQWQSARFILDLQQKIKSGWADVSDALRAYHERFMSIQQEQQRTAGLLAGFGAQFGGKTPQEWFMNTGSMMANLENIGLNNGSLNGVKLFTEQQAQQAETMANAFKNMAAYTDQMQPLIDAGLFSEDQVKQIKDMADQAQKLADNIQKGADAAKNMTFGQMLGQTGGGALGDFTDQYMAYLQQSGMSPDQIKKLQDAFDMASGRQTSLSKGMPDFFAQISSLSAGDQVQAALRLQQSLALARTLGVSPDMLVGGNLDFFAGLAGGAGRQIKVGAGDNLYSLARRYGGSIDDYRSLMKNGILPQGTFNLAGGASLIPGFDPQQAMNALLGMGGTGQGFGTGGMDFSQQMTQASDSAKDIAAKGTEFQEAIGRAAEALKAVDNTEVHIRIKPEIEEWFKKILMGGSNAFEVVQSVNTQNGNASPGANTARPRAGRVIDR